MVSGGLKQMLLGSVERAPWGWGLFFLTMAGLIKGWPAIADATLRAKMALGDRRLSRIERLEAKLETQNAAHIAEASILRHQVNNMRMCLDMLLMLIETQPERASEHAARIRKMREDQHHSETVEKATIRAASIVDAQTVEREASS